MSNYWRIRTYLQPDQAYVNRREALRREEQEKEDQLRKLQEKKEYELRRAEIADVLSKVYGSDMTQVFAELASGTISPEEASIRVEERQRNRSAENFNEKTRQIEKALSLIEMMRNSELGSPDGLLQRGDQILGSLFGPSATALNGGGPSVPALGGDSPEQEDEILYEPPSDD